GSTALHVAAYYGHSTIVKLLLDADACRSIRNRHGRTAFEESSIPEIKSLFNREADTSRFIGSSDEVDWLDKDPSASKNVRRYKQLEKQWVETVYMQEKNQLSLRDPMRYLDARFKDTPGIKQIKYYIEVAEREKKVE
ncbi:unnamed protein product, partial [Didymodactylos carnosus]